MCRHLEGKKIKFTEFFEHRYNAATTKPNEVALKNALDLPTAALFLIALFLILSMQLLIDFIDWKFVKYEEVFIENLKS